MSRKSRRKSSARKSSGSRFFKWLAIGGGLFVVLAIVGVVLGYRAVRSYLKSDDFRVMLEEKASDSLGGQATFQPFDWAGWSLTTNEFQFAGEEAVTNLRVSNIGASVDIGAVWDGIYRIENVSLRQVELTADLRGGDEVIQDDVFRRLSACHNVTFTGHQAFLTEEALTAIATTSLNSDKAFSEGTTSGNEIITEVPDHH